MAADLAKQQGGGGRRRLWDLPPLQATPGAAGGEHRTAVGNVSWVRMEGEWTRKEGYGVRVRVSFVDSGKKGLWDMDGASMDE
eukprot:scaffold48556_cov58-Phaeocystis_antarctica.AAC.1